jgi:hypothetical protein
MSKIQRIRINNKSYRVRALRRHKTKGKAVSIVQASHNGRELTQVSLESIRRFTRVPYELWVVDNFSDPDTVNFLLSQQDVNLILNYTPIGGWSLKYGRYLPIPVLPGRDAWRHITGGGSICNGIALELAAKFIETDYVFVMHNDALVYRDSWLEYVLSKVNTKVRGVGMIADADKHRIGAMHQSGFLFDFNLYKPLNMDMSAYIGKNIEPGDDVTLKLRQADYDIFICKNTFNDSGLIERIPGEDPLRYMNCDRIFDDQWNIIYLHLGRGTMKSEDKYHSKSRLTARQWVDFAKGSLYG